MDNSGFCANYTPMQAGLFERLADLEAGLRAIRTSVDNIVPALEVLKPPALEEAIPPVEEAIPPVNSGPSWEWPALELAMNGTTFLVFLCILSNVGKIIYVGLQAWAFGKWIAQKIRRLSEPSVSFRSVNIDRGHERMMQGSSFTPPAEHKFATAISCSGQHVGYAIRILNALVTPKHVLDHIRAHYGTDRFQVSLGDKKLTLDMEGFTQLYGDMSYALYDSNFFSTLGLKEANIHPPMDATVTITACNKSSSGKISGTNIDTMAQYTGSTHGGFSGAPIMLNSKVIAIHLGVLGEVNSAYWAAWVEKEITQRVGAAAPESGMFEDAHVRVLSSAEQSAQKLDKFLGPNRRVPRHQKIPQAKFDELLNQVSAWADEVDLYEDYEPEAAGRMTPAMKRALAEALARAFQPHAPGGNDEPEEQPTEEDDAICELMTQLDNLTERVDKMELQLKTLTEKLSTAPQAVASMQTAPKREKCTFCKRTVKNLSFHIGQNHIDEMMKVYNHKMGTPVDEPESGPGPKTPGMAGSAFPSDNVREGASFLGRGSPRKRSPNSKKTSSTSARANPSPPAADIQSQIHDFQRCLGDFLTAIQKTAVGPNQGTMRN